MPDHSRTDGALEKTIEDLLEDEQYLDHPLREALYQLWTNTREPLAKLERITHISDRYQSVAQEKTRYLSERYERQLRQIEKITRISDRYQLMLQDLNSALQEASTHDYLTGLANRRLIVDCLKQADQRSVHKGVAYAVALIDADRFKQINDGYGHDSGDQILVALSRTLKESLRECDLCGRWGGEEFFALLVDTDVETARLVAERILQGVRHLGIPLDQGLLTVTVSIGIAEHRAGESYSDTIRRADLALYEAKRGGRDRWMLR